MTRIIVVAAGGALGAVARYLLTAGLHRAWPGPFPIGTTTVNLAGGLAIGLLAGVLAVRDGGADHHLALFLMDGVCGGFTTFSAFSLETVRLVHSGAAVTAIAAVMLQVGGTLVATLVGLWLARQF